MKGSVFFILCLFQLTPLHAAWWNDSWAYKKKINLDKVAMQQAGVTVPAGGLALLRLHTGNFSFFLDVAEGGKDLRFVAADQQTPLKFAIEKFDPINEMALIWVRLPADIAAAEQPVIWMYYGNPEAVDGQASAALYDDSRVLTYHFGADGVFDATAYGHQPDEVSATTSSAGVIAEAAQFDGQQRILIPDSPSLPMSPNSGWTLAFWIRLDQTLDDAVVFQRGAGAFTLAIVEQRLQATFTDVQGEQHSLAAADELSSGGWHYIVLSADQTGAILYVDGAVAGEMKAETPVLPGDISVGADAEGQRGFIGLIDELALMSQPASAAAIKFSYRMQGLNNTLLVYGEDLSEADNDDGEPSYLQATLDNVSVDGWTVIGALAVMMFVSWMVMITKGLVLAKVRKENARFIADFEQLGISELDKLNRPESEDDEEALESPLMLSITGGHEKFQGSSIYRIYHAGVEEINHRLPKAAGADIADFVMSSQSIEAIRASMDAALVRENQRLNSQMVLLTIAISGGPFLGLLGTVLGVMITFAAIAVQGEVNVNAIAPGVAAALSTTVAGLIVAIPALFGYNYLGSRIKETSADMYVFVDEFVSKIAERFS